MKGLKVLAMVIAIAKVSAAQKEVPLPKDLPPYTAEQPLRAPDISRCSAVNKIG